jgi:hypothetical protein
MAGGVGHAPATPAPLRQDQQAVLGLGNHGDRGDDEEDGDQQPVAA